MNATNIDRPFGFLTWWTIRQGIYSVNMLKDLAQRNNLPGEIQNRLTGAEERSAWLRSTQLGAVGKDAPHQDGMRGKFFTRDLGGEVRGIVYELVDRNEKRVSARQIATLGRDGRDILADVEGWALENSDLVTAVTDLIHEMQDELDNRIGQIDDEKVRSLVLGWLQNKRRVCVRGTGGVYFIPGTDSSLKDEILSVRQWIIDTDLGNFSTVTLRDDGATSISDIQESAVEEIYKELQEISDALDKYEANENMNDGSRMYSSGQQVKKIQELEEKIKVLNDNLGDIQDRVNASFTVVAATARKMFKRSQHNVAVGKGQPVNSPQANEAGKKAGTVFDRNKKKVVA